MGLGADCCVSGPVFDMRQFVHPPWTPRACPRGGRACLDGWRSSVLGFVRLPFLVDAYPLLVALGDMIKQM